MKRIYVFSCILLISIKSFSQVASCVHGGGIGYLLDAFSASLGACNCQKASGFLFSMPPCNNGSYYLAFEDNFDGNSLDVSKWEIQPWGQGAIQTYATSPNYPPSMDATGYHQEYEILWIEIGQE